MTAATLTLTDFLLARIAGDEAVAREAVGDRWRRGDLPGHVDRVVPADYITLGDVAVGAPSTAEHIIRHDPARVLAECEAKRRIVELHAELAYDDCEYSGWQGLALDTLCALASVYVDHPDYREEWKP